MTTTVLRQPQRMLDLCGRVEYGPGQRGRRPTVTCRSPWLCPKCTPEIAATRAVEIARARAAHRALGGGVYLLTAAPPQVGLALGEQWQALDRRYDTMWAGRSGVRLREDFGLLGRITITHVSHNARGWNPHRHDLVFSALPWEAGVGDFFRRAVEWWRGRGAPAMPTQGPPSKLQPFAIPLDAWEPDGLVDVREVEDGGEIERYLTRTSARSGGGLFPLDLLARGSDALVGEFLAASKRRQPVRWSPGLRDWLAA